MYVILYIISQLATYIQLQHTFTSCCCNHRYGCFYGHAKIHLVKHAKRTVFSIA